MLSSFFEKVNGNSVAPYLPARPCNRDENIIGVFDPNVNGFQHGGFRVTCCYCVVDPDLDLYDNDLVVN